MSVDYAGLVRGLRMPLTPDDLGAALLDAVAERYEHQFPDCSLLQFVQSGATYLFDLASAVGAEQEDRTLAAWTITPATVGKRDVSYQRGFPLPPDPDGTLADRGHLFPHFPGAVPRSTTRRASPALSGELGRHGGWVQTMTVLADGRLLTVGGTTSGC